jgi:hypothetical protein
MKHLLHEAQKIGIITSFSEFQFTFSEFQFTFSDQINLE